MSDKTYGSFEISGCPEIEHRIIRVDDKYIFQHADGTECEKTRKMEWYELADRMEPLFSMS